MGELASLGTAFLWALTAILFTFAGRSVGSALVNRTRVIFAVVFLSITHLVLEGQLFPTGVSLDEWFWLGISGIFGLMIGDAFLFQAFVLIGPRISMLVMAIVPVISTILATLFLDQILSSFQLVAVAITISGIAWVVWESNGGIDPEETRNFGVGVLFALGGALGQALGLITSQKGLSNGFPPLSGSLIRMSVALVGMWTLTALRGELMRSWNTLRTKNVIKTIIAASFVGPYLGVWLSLISITLAPVGIASTLMGLTPIILLPLSRWIFKERYSSRVVLGTLTAFAGVAMIFIAS
jgi:drug/metabolite transporter (DMT)-like permease